MADIPDIQDTRFLQTQYKKSPKFNLTPKFKYWVDLTDIFLTMESNFSTGGSMAKQTNPGNKYIVTNKSIPKDFKGKIISTVGSVSEVQLPDTVILYPIDKKWDKNPMVGEFYKEYNGILSNNGILVKNISMPEYSIETHDYAVGGTRISGNIKSGDIEALVLEFYEDTSKFARKLYYAWLSCALDFNTNTRYPVDFYESNIKIKIFNMKNDLIEERTYHGCFPKNISGQDLDATNRGFMEGCKLTVIVNNGMTIVV